MSPVRTKHVSVDIYKNLHIEPFYYAIKNLLLRREHKKNKLAKKFLPDNVIIPSVSPRGFFALQA